MSAAEQGCDMMSGGRRGFACHRYRQHVSANTVLASERNHTLLGVRPIENDPGVGRGETRVIRCGNSGAVPLGHAGKHGLDGSRKDIKDSRVG